MPSLRRTLTAQIVGVIVCLLLVAATAVWGIRRLNQDFSVATRGYERLRGVYEIAAHVAAARTLLSLERPEIARAGLELDAAAAKVQRDPSLKDLAASIRAAQAALYRAEAQQTYDVDPRPFQQAYGNASTAAGDIRASIVRAEASARTTRQFTIAAVSMTSGVLIVGAIGIGLWQYRVVMRPITRLNAGVRRVASGRFDHELDGGRFSEFAALSADFNQMARQLDQLYHHLEQQVATKSQELVRSQRLASVGFLAAGVAHEINNPLGIITGYAEFTLQQLRQSPQRDEALEKSLTAICDEAYRCKQITEKLLSMARSTDAPRASIDLADAARAVIDNLQALRRDRAGQIRLIAEAVQVNANEAELKQVILNLLTNAIEATTPADTIEVHVTRANDQAQLRVKDTGRGINAATLASVFEPFFTQQKGERRGTGLGLSISHAIIEAHNGSLRATSDGEGKGSEFIVTLAAL